MIKSSPVYIFATVLCIIFLSCSSTIPKTELWEGIHNNILRVFVHYEHPDDFDGRITTATKEQVHEAGRARAEILLLSYIRMHVTDVEKVIECQQMIAGIIEKGTMRYFKCDTQHCSAFFNFDVKDLLKTAGIHYSQ